MPRKFPNIQLPVQDEPSEKLLVSVKEYHIEIVTPMFGGGTVPGENDKEGMLIRPSSIRGHLRFWWRALRGAVYKNAQEMREAENDIWGSIDSPSAVRVRVTGQPSLTQQRTPENNFGFARFGPEAYALFAARSNGNSLLKEGGKFIIKITYPANWNTGAENNKFRCNIEAPLWAWTNFGGIGARTRRGCGALFCKDFAPPTSLPLNIWLKDNIKKFGIKMTTEHRPWLLFGERILVGGATDKPDAWNRILGFFQKFRQGVDVGRNVGQEPNRPGRSFWPEPDAIRTITGRSAVKHRKFFPDEKQGERVFPRAEFGLPIITHFVGHDEPSDTTLLPWVDGENKDRMGSPLILKPLVLQDGNAVPCALLLNTEPIQEVVLEPNGGNKPYPVRSQNSQYEKSPLKGRSANGSALEGFLKYLEEKEYKEVLR